MNTHRLKTIQEYARRRDGLVASICLPTEISGKETRKSPILFKNLLREVRDALEGRQDAKALLQQIEASCEPMLDDYDFWQHQSAGLAVFCEPERCQFVRLPFSPRAGFYLGDRFHVKPLVRLINRDQTYFVLALSANSCRLYWGDRQGLEVVQVEGLPASMEEALQLDDPQQNLQFHTGTSAGGGGGRSAMFHGQGGGKENPEARMEQYVEKVAAAVSVFLKRGAVSNDGKAPLLLASVEESAPLYARHNTYAAFAESAMVRGNPDELKPDALHKAAWPLVDAILKKRETDLLVDFGTLLAHEKASTQLSDIAAAIKGGRVMAVFVAEDKMAPGKMAAGNGRIELSRDTDSESDLLNDIAAEALLLGGDPYVMPASEIPGDSGAAAIFRF